MVEKFSDKDTKNGSFFKQMCNDASGLMLKESENQLKIIFGKTLQNVSASDKLTV